ncbi:MAG: pyruvate formate lyase family protein, partial [Armatimonadota bacterium]
VCPGHPDRWLWPYYERDIAEGRLTPARAQELLDCFNILINETVGRGLAIGTMIGGRDKTGADVTNTVSYMCLQSVRNVRLSYPGLGICWHPETPDSLLDFGCEVLSEMGANPAIFNDEVITQGLMNAGVAPEEACEYQNSTCVEITPVGASNVWVASPYFNLCQNLLDVLEDIRDETVDADDFETLMETYFQRLAGRIREAVIEQNEKRYSCMHHRTFPLQSCFVRDCIERGLDVEQGGARYNWVEGSFVGLANLVDSLAVIRRYIYEDGAMTVEELLDILAKDFESHEPLRQAFINRVPSYGNDEPEVDDLAVKVTEFVSEECAKYETLFEGSYQPGFFCWVMHERLGSQTGATPDGRKAATPFADGAGPAQGREKKGPTAAVKSTTKWDHTPMLGGLVLNLKFSDTALQSAESRSKLADLIRTYMRLGGFEVQVNVVSRDTLLAAQQSPEQYRDLVVRVAGYTDYFTNLSEALQNDIINRTEHETV